MGSKAPDCRRSYRVPVLLVKQPIKRPTQLRGAVALVPAAVGEHDAFGLPGQHAFDRGLELRALAYEGAAHVARHRAVRVLHAAQAGEPAHPPAAELAGDRKSTRLNSSHSFASRMPS